MATNILTFAGLSKLAFWEIANEAKAYVAEEIRANLYPEGARLNHSRAGWELALMGQAKCVFVFLLVRLLIVVINV